MEYLYKSVYKRARTELVVEKSKFIATVTSCNTREEAEAFFAEIRKEFKDATHNVPAFIIGNKMEVKWASDDGEPQGTSGPPILRFLEMNEITNVAIMVTRYFGGIKLGTGGLVRAYSSAAELAVNEAGLGAGIMVTPFRIDLDYSDYNKFTAYKFPDRIKETFKIIKTDFEDKVKLDLSCGTEIYDEIIGVLMEMTNGKISPEKGEDYIEIVALTSAP